MFGQVAGMGLGPGVLFGSVGFAAYGLVRRDHIPTLGYLLLIGGMVFVAGLTLVVARSREGM